MTKVKTCKFFNEHETGACIFIDHDCNICYDRSIKLLKNVDYANIDIDTILQNRKNFINAVRNSETHECDGCQCLYEKEEKDIKTDKISWLNIASFTTCTLRCKYCYFNEQQLSAKLSEETDKLMPIVKQFHDKGVLSDKIILAIAGGEPLLFKDIPETLKFLKQNYAHPGLNLQSNCTMTEKSEELADELVKIKLDWANLYVSLDSGTKETFKQIRGRDLFDVVKNNILNYAKKNCFTSIQLKYILLNDKENEMYNLSTEDIDGFCKFVYQVKNLTNSHVSILVDRDLKYGNSNLDDETKDAAVRITKFANAYNIPCIYSACGYINHNDKIKIKNMALSLKFKDKLFSIKNEGSHKVIRLLGLKFKIQRGKNGK